ncbi:MAG: ABC transporter permease, partial [Acidobacteria bacterium]|nr:ABC transporter permease [Acidobacteriota bacterium]
ARLVDEAMGTAVYMEINALHRLLREGGSLSAVTLSADPNAFKRIYDRLKATPAVAAVSLKTAALQNFQDTMGQNLGLITFFNILFASIIAVGVIYNSARISLSERGRDLASLRVLGFTRREISFILLGEMAILTAVSLPAGLALGYGLASWTVKAFENELYRIPLIVAPRTYGIAALTVVLASLASALAVRRRLDHLDLVAVLKTRE